MQSIAERTRKTDPLPEHCTYRATLRNFGQCVEMSVREVPADEMARHLHTMVPVHLLPLTAMTTEERERRDEENLRRAERHAKQQVRWLLKGMQADHLLTLTYRENVTDMERVGKDWQKFVRLVRARFPDFRYVAVREKQERGSIHLHIAIHGRADVHWLRRCWWIALGHKVEIDYSEEGKKKLLPLVKDGREWRYARSDEVRGNIDVSGPSRRFGGHGARWKTEKLAAYMTKYMAKAFGQVTSGRRYWPSKNLVRREPQKFWLVAARFEDAVREAHGMMRDRFGCAELTIWQSNDMTRLWFSGSGVLCPF